MIRIIKTAILVSIISIFWVARVSAENSPNPKASIMFFGDSITFGRNDSSHYSDYPTYVEEDLASLSWFGWPFSYPGCVFPTTPEPNRDFGWQQGCIDNAGLPGEHAASPCSLDSCPVSGDTSCQSSKYRGLSGQGLSDSCVRLIDRIKAINPNTLTTLIYWEGGNDFLTYFCNQMGTRTNIPTFNDPPFKCLRKRIVDCLSYVHNQYSSVNIILGTYYQMDPNQWENYLQWWQCIPWLNPSCECDIHDATTVANFNKFINSANSAISQVQNDLSQVGVTVSVGPPASNLGTMPWGHVCEDVHPSDYGNQLIAYEWCKVIMGPWLWWTCPPPPSSPPNTNPC